VRPRCVRRSRARNGSVPPQLSRTNSLTRPIAVFFFNYAVAQRAKVAGHTLRRPRAAPDVRDALLFPTTVPSVV